MPNYRTPLAATTLSILSITFLFFYSTCRAKPSPIPTNNYAEEESNNNSTQDLGFLALDERITLSDGTHDLKNQYSSTVTTEAMLPGGDIIRCSGIIINPRVVLTAGHCVCTDHKDTALKPDITSIIDNKECAQTATITTTLYNLQASGGETPESSLSQTYTGKTQPHPDLRILLDKAGAAISVTADLALIILDKTVQKEIPAIQLSATEIKLGDSITLAGYGHNATSGTIYGIRRFGTKRVRAFLNPETILLEQQDSEAFTTGSGEPCLRREGKDMLIIGITSRDINESPAFINTHTHRTWIHTEQQKATQHHNP